MIEIEIISDDELTQRWVQALNNYHVTQHEDWKKEVSRLDDELLKRGLGRRRLAVILPK